MIDVQRRVKAGVPMVWGIVSDLTGDPGVPPFAKRVEPLGDAAGGEGLQRKVVGRDGDTWVETCVAWEPEKLYTVEAEAANFPVRCARLRYTCSVAEDAGTVRIRLYYDYTPRFGMLGSFLERFGERRKLESLASQVLDNWVRIIHAREWAYRVTARTILEEKGGHVHSVAPATPISEVVSMLREFRIGSLLVLDGRGGLVGVLSERDVVRALAERGAGLLAEAAESIMTRDVITASPDDHMMSIMGVMSERRIRHLPVVTGDEVLGLISIGDVIKARISELEGQSETLLDYIEARRWHELYNEVGPAAYAES